MEPPSPLHITELQQIFLKNDVKIQTGEKEQTHITTYNISFYMHQKYPLFLPLLGCLDKDGDEEVPRRRYQRKRQPLASACIESAVKETDSYTPIPQISVSIFHTVTPTSLTDVGFQIWQGCFLLCDFILSFPGLFEGKYVVDLGCGMGLTSIVASIYAEHVFATDCNDQVLERCKRNVQSNCVTHPSEELGQPKSVVSVRKFDWMDSDSLCPITAFHQRSSGDPFGWAETDNAFLHEATIFIAADCIFDDDVSQAFVAMLRVALFGQRKLYMTIERRVVFTIQDMAPVPHAYLYFLQELVIHQFRIQYLPLDESCIRKHFPYSRSNNLILLMVQGPL